MENTKDAYLEEMLIKFKVATWTEQEEIIECLKAEGYVDEAEKLEEERRVAREEFEKDEGLDLYWLKNQDA
jgi:hypothetical protein